MIVDDVRRSGGSVKLRQSWNPWLTLRRRRVTIAVASALGMSAAWLGYVNAPSSYVSQAVVVLDVRRVQAIPNESVVSPLPQDSPVLRTQLDIIGSRTLATNVIQRLKREGINVEEHRFVDWSPVSLVRTATSLIAPGAVEAPSETEVEELAATASDERLIDLLLSNLRVSNDGRSYTIFISYASAKPEISASVANAFARSYLAHQIEIQKAANRRVSDWLGETLVGLRAQLEQSEQALEHFRQSAGLIQTNGVSLQSMAVAAANTETARVKGTIATAEARLEVVKRLAGEQDVPALAEFLGSTAIQTLHAEHSRVERELDTLQKSGAIRSRQIDLLTAEKDALGRQISVEVDRLIQSLANEAAIARENLAALGQSLQAAQAELSEANNAELTAAQLQREATANRSIYESYLVRYKQTIEQDGFEMPEAQLISPAQPAAARASPRRSNWALLGLGLSGCLAAFGIVWREMTDRRLRILRDVETTGIPVIGAVPPLPVRRGGRFETVADQATPLGLALSGIRLSLRARGKKVVAVTSSASGRGKTSLALGLVRSAAAAGLKAVVVEADLRNPRLAEIAGLKPDEWLDGILDSELASDAVIHRDPQSQACIVPARARKVAPELFLQSSAFGQFIARLRESFELVVLDAPDLDRANDAIVIAGLADCSLFVVDCERDRSEHVLDALRRMTAIGSAPDGIVLNRATRNVALEPELSPETTSWSLRRQPADPATGQGSVIRIAR